MAVALDFAISKKIGNEKVNTTYEDVIFDDRIFIKNKGKYIKVFFDEILFIQASGSYCVIQTKLTQMTLSMNMKTLCEKLNHSSFIRIHRKYVVNVANIDSFDQNYVYIDKFHLDVGDSYKNDFLSKFKYI